MTERSVGGARYYVRFKDDYSKFRRVFSITTKSKVADCLRKFLKEVKTAGHVTKVLLSDGGKQFNCEALQKVLEEHGITHRLTMASTPEQNGAAGQENRKSWKALVLCFIRVDCRNNCGLKPVILRYTYSTVLDLHQWKVGRLWKCGMDFMQLLVTSVFLGQNGMCTFPNRKGTSGTKGVGYG